MKKILLLLTELFPYGKTAETFLEPEIDIARKYFDEIYIIPSSQIKKYNEKRELSYKNVYISPVKREFLLIECIKSFRYIVKHKGFWQDIKMLSENGIIKKVSAWRKLIYAILTEAAIFRHFKSVPFIIDKNASIVIYSYWLFGEAGGAIAIKKLFENKQTIAVARAHGTDIVGYRSIKYYSPLKKYYLDELDVVYPISENGKEHLVKHYQKYNCNSEAILEKIHSIHLGVEIMDKIEKQKNLIDNVFTIVSCSSIIPVKRVHLIIEGLSYIHTNRIKWIHLGGGELLEDAKSKCKEVLGENISYEFKGALSRKSVIDFYKNNNIHLFINVSSSEGIPVSMMEAFSFGIPAIATNVGGVSELCYDEINGFLLQKDFKPIELSKLILKIINIIENNYNEYLLMRQNARSTIVNEFSLKNHDKFYNQIIEKVNGDYIDNYCEKAKL